jgi:hypothetical protein
VRILTTVLLPKTTPRASCRRPRYRVGRGRSDHDVGALRRAAQSS